VSQGTDFTFIGDISDEAIEALAALLLSITEQENQASEEEEVRS